MIHEKPATPTEPSVPKFEDAIRELETIAGRLEKGDAPLDQALSMFTRGVELAGLCSRMLDEAERTIQQLATGEHGRSVLRPFEAPAAK